jgi:hypothetical protein
VDETKTKKFETKTLWAERCVASGRWGKIKRRSDFRCRTLDPVPEHGKVGFLLGEALGWGHR